MNEREAAAIAGRLSLRAPQRQSLELLARIAGDLDLAKEPDLNAALATVSAAAPSVTDFERSFPSLCFALATGVGKTRLMGAFIAYLYRVHGLKHFFVLAPNLTIYEKLKADFTPNTPKYVFPGLGDIADQLVLITGDDWQDGRGVRAHDLRADRALHVNVFNVAKINTEARGGNAPRMKRLHEVIGDSYFDYLAKLDDLVLIMDESHRYRAQAGVRAIEGLRPILGLELTATPQTVHGSRVQPFKNVAFQYPLPNAIHDGLVKEPAVATRANFDASRYDPDALERLKLEDGVRLHEQTKAHLQAYAAERGLPLVKPFILVVAESVAHGEDVKTLMESDGFCEGRYAGRVIIVHSNQSGEIKDENLQRLLRVEEPSEPTEVVIHVNKLGEGWDVTNLYTIIPLRAANSVNLVEQSLGRGLRLPYGRRTGVEAVDRLTVVSHDRFEEIVRRAQDPDSLVRAFREVLIDDDTAAPLETVRAEPLVHALISDGASLGLRGDPRSATDKSPRATTPAVDLRSPEERQLARVAVEVASDPAIGFTWAELHSNEGRERHLKLMYERAVEAQGVLGLGLPSVDTARVAAEALSILAQHTIAIPRIVLQPRDEVRIAFAPFRLDLTGVRPQPMPQEILVQALQSQRQTLIESGLGDTQGNINDHLVRLLAEDPAIAYESHAALLYDLAAQMVEHIGRSIDDPEGVRNVVFTQGRDLARVILEQLHAQRIDAPVEYVATVRGDVHRPRAVVGVANAGAAVLDFRSPIASPSGIRRLRFGNFRRCLFTEQRFHSDAERRLAVILENDPDETLKWYKPANGDFVIWLRGGAAYNPDFVVESAAGKYLIEPKADDELRSDDVKEKAAAARVWCEHASRWEAERGGKEWRYLLLPDSAIVANATLSGLSARFGNSGG